MSVLRKRSGFGAAFALALFSIIASPAFGQELAPDLAGSYLGATHLATLRPDSASSMLLQIRALTDDGVFDEADTETLMTSAERLCEDVGVSCREVKSALQQDARAHAAQVERRVLRWIKDGTLPAQPEAQEIRELIALDREKAIEDELVVTAPRLQNRYYKPAVDIHHALNNRRLGLWHYNKATLHEDSAAKHRKQGRTQEAEEQSAAALREYRTAFPYLLAAARQGLKWPALTLGFLYLNGKAGDLTPRTPESIEAGVGWIGVAAAGRADPRMKRYFREIKKQVPPELSEELDSIVEDFVAKWGAAAHGVECRQEHTTRSLLSCFRCSYPNPVGEDAFSWDGSPAWLETQ